MSATINPSKKHQPVTSGTLNGGEQYVYKFPNGYGASVIRSIMSYGGNSGRFELAVLDADGHLTYDTPITSDVIGHIEPADLDAILDQIEALGAAA